MVEFFKDPLGAVGDFAVSTALSSAGMVAKSVDLASSIMFGSRNIIVDVLDKSKTVSIQLGSTFVPVISAFNTAIVPMLPVTMNHSLVPNLPFSSMIPYLPNLPGIAIDFFMPGGGLQQVLSFGRDLLLDNILKKITVIFEVFQGILDGDATLVNSFLNNLTYMIKVLLVSNITNFLCHFKTLIKDIFVIFDEYVDFTALDDTLLPVISTIMKMIKGVIV